MVGETSHDPGSAGLSAGEHGRAGLARQEAIVASARAAGFYVAAVYSEKASGARLDRPELLRMVADLQPGEVVVAEKIERISRLPLPEAELLVATIRGKGARLAVPGIVDLTDLVADSSGVARVVLEAVQDMLLRISLQTARARCDAGQSLFGQSTRNW